MRADGTFIAIDVADVLAGDAAVTAKLNEVCPVDIFHKGTDGTLVLNEKNLDECVLCRLCLDATPQGGVTVIKLYDDGVTL